MAVSPINTHITSVFTQYFLGSTINAQVSVFYTNNRILTDLVRIAFTTVILQTTTSGPASAGRVQKHGHTRISASTE